jgi:hypothetical protein
MGVVLIVLVGLELLELTFIADLFSLEVLVLLQLNLLLNLVFKNLACALLNLLRVLVDGRQLVKRVIVLQLLRFLRLLLLLLLVKAQNHDELLLEHLRLLYHLSCLLLLWKILNDFDD